MEIGTNIYNELTEDEKRKIAKTFSSIGEVKLFNYDEKGLPVQDIVKFVFRDFNLLHVVRDGFIYGIFAGGIKWLWDLAHKKKPKAEVEVWISFNSINIILSDVELEKCLDSLPKIMLGLHMEEGKTYWLTFKNGSWTITKF